MTQLFPIAAITDEFSQDIEAAVRSMAEIGMGGAELRMVFGKNVIDLTDAELHHAREIVGRHGLEIVSIASPLLKCVLPDAPAGARQHRQNASMFRGGEGAIPFSGRGRIYVEFGYLDDTTLSYRGYHRRVLARYRGCGALDGGDRHGRRRVAHGFRKERYRPDGCRVAPRAGNRGAARPRNRFHRIAFAEVRPAGCARGGAPTSTKGVDVARGRRGDTAIPFSGRGRIYVEFGYLDDTTLSYCGDHRRVLARYRGCGALDGGDRHGRRRVAHGFRKERYRPDGCRVGPRAGNRGAARPRNRFHRIAFAEVHPAGCARCGAPTSTKGVDVSRGRRGDTAIPFSGRGRIYVEFGYLDDTTLSYCGHHRRVLARYRGCGALDGGDRHGRRRVAHGFRKERYRPDGCRVGPRAGNRGAARPRNRFHRIAFAEVHPAGCARGGRSFSAGCVRRHAHLRRSAAFGGPRRQTTPATSPRVQRRRGCWKRWRIRI